MDPLIISIIVGVAIAAAGFAIYMIFNDFSATKAEDRLDLFTGKTKAVEELEKVRQQITKESLEENENSGSLGMMFSRFSGSFANVPLLIEQSDAPINLETFGLISLALGGAGLGGAVLCQAPLPLYPVCAISAAFLPMMWLIMRRKSRFAKFGKQLPDALELVGRALRSGHSLASGLQVVVAEMPEPISKEFQMAYEEQNLGIPIDQSLKNIFRRIPNLDLKFFVTAVAIQRQSGGDLAEILDKIGFIIRERFRIQGQVQALTGEGRISGIVLMALPVVLFFVMYYLNPEYMMLLFTEELGRKMIAGAIVMQILGAITIRKIIEIKI